MVEEGGERRRERGVELFFAGGNGKVHHEFTPDLMRKKNKERK